MIYKQINNQSGQVLLFVTVIMTIALSVGTAVSTRTISSLSRVATEDTSTKVLAAAESAIETYLAKDISDLKLLPSETITYEDEITGINTFADISVESYKFNNPEENGIVFNLETGNVKEINLKGYNGNVEVCWENNESANDSALAVNIYGEESILQKTVLVSDNSSIDNNIEGSIDVVGTDGCRDIVVATGSLGLRIRALYNSTNVLVKPSDRDGFPTQGYKIKADAKLQEEGRVTTSRTVIAYRSLNYLSSAFDYTVYSQDEFNN